MEEKQRWDNLNVRKERGSVHYPDKCFPVRDTFECKSDILLQLLEIYV